MASMLLTVASNVQRRIAGLQTAGEPLGGRTTESATRQSPAKPAAAQGKPEDDGMVTLESSVAVSSGLKDLLTLQEEEQQSLWSLNAALQACIAV